MGRGCDPEMSDFAGLWRLDGRPVSNADLVPLAQGLTGRGIGPPRVWHSGSFGLVHLQHSHTPEDRLERMPLAGASGRVLAADLRLDAREELLNALDASAEAARLPDGALLMRALERWDVESALPRLIGPFAFALWDPAERRLFLARDPLGGRSLFVHRGPGLVAFSTRMRALLALRDIPLDLDELALAEWLTFSGQRPARTLYRAIDRVPLRHTVVLDETSTRAFQWWTPPMPARTDVRSDAEVMEAAIEVTDRAVRAALRANGPACVTLTGGMDSAAVTLSAARQTAPVRLTALTRVPDAETAPPKGQVYHDEGPRAAAIAACHPGLDWHAIHDDGDDWGERDERRWFLESGDPCRAFINVSWFFPVYRFMAARDSRVLITGSGGNLYFSNDGLLRLLTLFRSLRWGPLTAELTALARAKGTGVLPQFKAHVLRPLEPPRLRRWRRGESPLPWHDFAALNPSFAEELGLARALDWHELSQRTGMPLRSVAQAQAMKHSNELGSDSMGVIRAMSGVDFRNPLFDLRVIDFFGRLPLDQFLRGGVTRSLTRRMLGAMLPAEITTTFGRGKQNGDWFARMSRRRPELLARFERLRASPLARRVVDLDRLETALRDWPADAATAETRRRELFHVVDRGMNLASFLAWREGGNL